MKVLVSKDTNKIKILTHSEQKFSLKSKDEVAKDILDFVETQLKNKFFKNSFEFNEKTTLHICAFLFLNLVLHKELNAQVQINYQQIGG